MLSGCIGSGENTSIDEAKMGVFPAIEGIDLQGDTRELPQTFAGKLNIVAIGFEREHQEGIDTWIPLADELSEKYDAVKFYEVPVIYKTNAAWRGWINNGMRMGIEDEQARERTITVYTDQDKFADIFNLNKENSAILLLNDDGQALWKHEGASDEPSRQALVQMVISAIEK